MKEYISSCDTCQRSKTTTSKPVGLLQPHEVPEGRWQTVTMDFAVPFKPSNGFDMVMIVVDKFKKHNHYIPTRKTDSAVEISDALLREIVRHHGMPRAIISDRDSKFTSKFWRALLKHIGTKLALSTANHPQTDGQSEVNVKTLKTMLRHYISYRQDNRAQFLTPLEIAYNRSVNPSTGYSPIELDCGIQPTMPHDLLKYG